MFNEDFWPTPRSVANRMIAKLSKDATHVLDPSAGKGDLADALKSHGIDHRGERGRFSIDCIEADPELATLLSGKGFPVVGYDWLSYDGVCYYDAIVMNPPFSNGDAHLMKAWEFMHDGEIVCLLNEETIANAHTQLRQKLGRIIAEHGNVEYLGPCFKTAQRKTDVRVVMVYLRKQSDDDRVEVWATATDEPSVNDSPDGPTAETMLAIQDKLGNMEHYYNMANEHMLKGYAHLRKASIYMDANHIHSGHQGKSYGDIAGMAMASLPSARAEFLKKHRRDSWFQVFEKMDFHKWLDKKQREELLRDVERDCNIPFTAANIKGTLENVFLQRQKLFEKSVANVFDELTRHYKGNAASEGWKSNDNYKVNDKLVFPWGCHFDSQYMGKFELSYTSGIIDIYTDLDRVMAVLDGTKFEEITTIGAALKRKFDRIGSTYHPGEGYSTGSNTVDSTYFIIKFWKKGTVHLKFRDRELWERFNITAAAGKKWLGENTNDTSEFPGRRKQHNASHPKPAPAPEPIPDEDEPPSEELPFFLV